MNRTKATKATGKQICGAMLAAVLAAALPAGGCLAAAEEDAKDCYETELTVFAAKSLSNVLEAVIEAYRAGQPGVEFQCSYDSSGTLMVQIQEGAACDVFFSAAETQMDRLEEEGFVTADTRRDVVNNQVCVVTYADSGTAVTGLSDLGSAKSIALAGASVPVGSYTRKAMVNAGILACDGEPEELTTRQISEALGGVEINECANVGAVAAAVAEGANEVGTVYYSDVCGFEDALEILEMVPYELTGDVIYPAAQIENREADDEERAAALDFVCFLTSDEAKAIFEAYKFDTDVEK